MSFFYVLCNLHDLSKLANMKIALPLENIDLMYNSKPNKNEQKSVQKCAKMSQNWVFFSGQKPPTCKYVFHHFRTSVL